MQSMIKREVSLSLTAHSEFIRQMILDGLEVAKHRQEKYKGSVHINSNAIYYRNMRQNGHSTALRTVFNAPEFDDIGVISLFLDNSQRLNFLNNSANTQNLKECLFWEKTFESDLGKLRGQKIEVLILNDYISIDAIKRGWNVIEKVSVQLPHLKLVVFLG
ncbi:putative histone-like protein [Erwinia phage phiEa2809]|uniref:Putative histone-like protein n=1 Tax=Erwinia phage phiEa2809 TaxID=1564096 RepID=A0A0A0YS03_9CAUD|nr:histone family DNA-binding [Erwinia phage phiEa2809]AIX13014.1 putative histone-like protein [Erwinia phage phiEa2809]